MENYKQKYKEALETARKINSGEGVAAPKDWSIPEIIFPELKKSEDELIREELIHFLECCQDTYLIGNRKRDKWIEWLENNPMSNMPEIKFKVGDWVIFKNDRPGSVYQVEKIENYEYTLRHILGGSMPLPFSSENLVRPWTIQDTKNSDVLASDNGVIILVKESRGSSWGYRLSYHCAVLHNGTFEPREFHVNPEEFFPATKKQSNLLFQKMKEAGYIWNSSKKVLTKYEQ